MYSRSDSNAGVFFLGCLAAIGLIAIGLMLSTLIICLFWGLIVPLIFPGAVAASLLPAALTFGQAFKLVILFICISLGTISGIAKINSDLEGCSGLVIRFIISWAIRIVLIVIGGLLVSLIWGWVVPDVMAGAVAQGVLPATMTWWHSMLLCFLMGILGLGSSMTNAKAD